MARLLLGAAVGVVVTLAATAFAGHADQADAEIQEAAAAAHVDPVKLQGAVNSTGDDPYVYLRAVGELAPATPPSEPTAPVSARAACIIRNESQGNPNAVNPRTGAAGLGQFLGSTWRSTPQGRAGLSVFNPSANQAAIQWMLNVGRAREFAVVTAGLC